MATTTYRITSQAGQDHGTWTGETPAAALAAMHRDAGYRSVRAEAGEIVWPDDETRRLCGDVDDWSIVSETYDDRISIDNGLTETSVSGLSAADLARIYPAAVALMDDDLREEVHAALAPCSDRAFLAAYCTRHYMLSGETLTVP